MTTKSATGAISRVIVRLPILISSTKTEAMSTIRQAARPQQDRDDDADAGSRARAPGVGLTAVAAPRSAPVPAPSDPPANLQRLCALDGVCEDSHRDHMVGRMRAGGGAAAQRPSFFAAAAFTYGTNVAVAVLSLVERADRRPHARPGRAWRRRLPDRNRLVHVQPGHVRRAGGQRELRGRGARVAALAGHELRALRAAVRRRCRRLPRRS